MARLSNHGAIIVSQKGDFNNSMKFLRFLGERKYLERIEYYAEMGRKALAEATPVDTGKTAASWKYEITENSKGLKITWLNDNTADGIPIVVLLYYGHGTPSGRFVQGRDFITPAMEPVFKEIMDNVCKEVTSN